MNRRQKIILGFGGTILLMMVLYSPFVFALDGYCFSASCPQEYTVYGFLFDPPSRSGWTPSINFSRLLSQALLLIVPIAFIYWLLKKED
jgi:hypothetical protein